MRRILALALLALPGLCCESEDTRLGPCIHVYEEPILNVTSVTSSENHHRLPAVWVKAVVFEGEEQDLLRLRKGVSVNVAYSDSGLYCTPPFGFGTERGTYELYIAAEGFEDTVVTVEAGYSVFRGGCPSSNTGGTRFVIRLNPS